MIGWNLRVLNQDHTTIHNTLNCVKGSVPKNQNVNFFGLKIIGIIELYLKALFNIHTLQLLGYISAQTHLTKIHSIQETLNLLRWADNRIVSKTEQKSWV